MNISEFNLANSSLEVTASGCTIDISNDLQLPDGKSIAQLIDENNNDKKEKE
jgi:hypothetical protein